MSADRRIARAILRHNRLLAVIFLILLAGLAAGIPRLEFSADNRGFFGADNQEFRDLQMLDRTYTGAAGLLVMVKPPEGTAFAPATLQTLRAMTEELWLTPHVLRVDGAANYSHSEGRGEEIVIELLLAAEGPISAAAAARFRDIALSEPTVRGRFVAEDGSAYGIGMLMVLPEDRVAGRLEIRSHLRALATRWQGENPGWEVRFTGGIMGALSLMDAARRDLIRLVPVAFVVVVACLALLLRSVAGVLSSMVVVVSGTLATLGFAGWAGVVLTAGTAISPLSVLVLMSASCTHMLLSWMRRGGDRAALEPALAENLGAITVTTLTTAFGFLCLNFAHSPPLQEMGNIIAFGLLFGLGAIFVLLPAGLTLARGAPARVLISSAAMERLADRIMARHRLWLWLFPLAICLAATGIARIGFDDNLARYFSPSTPFRADTEVISTHLNGLDSLEFSFTVPETASGETSVFDPDFLRAIDRFERWLAGQPGVTSTGSIATLLRGLNKAMNSGDPAYDRIADTVEANAQLLLLYELSLPAGHDLTTRIGVDRRQTRLSAALRVDHSADIRELAQRSEAWLAENEPQIATRAAGISIAFARIAQRNNSQMLVGLGVVLVLVSATMMVTLRSAAFGAISLAPNLVPAILAFGLWGYTLRDVNLGSAVVTTMTFGIVVDDTVHFLMHYLRRRRAGLAVEAAMRDTFSTVGAAIIVTTLSLVAGFAVMALSGFVINQHIGVLTVFVVGFALLADLLFLPALLLRFRKLRT